MGYATYIGKVIATYIKVIRAKYIVRILATIL